MANYWTERKALNRVVLSEKTGKKTMRQVYSIYKQALVNINKEINKLFVNYADKVGLDVGELTTLITGAERTDFLRSVKSKMAAIGLNVNDVYDENYIRRLTRLEAMKHQVYWEIMQIAPKEEAVTGLGYSKIIEQTYNKITYDIEVYKGISTGFGTIDTSTINEILRSNWVGRNYSKSVWKNTNELAKKLPTVLGGALVSGQSYAKTSRLLREDLLKNQYWKATRLVRTETIYFNNQAELQAYEDEDIKQYEYVAVLDGRTSETCLEHDGKVYNVSQAEAGVNYPPLHPNCRSTTKPVINGNKIKSVEVRNGRVQEVSEDARNAKKEKLLTAVGPTKRRKDKIVNDAVNLTNVEKR